MPDSKLVFQPANKSTNAIIKTTLAQYPDAHCELTYNSAWELLVAVILSAQCTDVRVNMVTPNLFKQFPTIKSMADAPPSALEQAIRSTGFYRNKSKHIQGAATAILLEHNGVVPDTMETLLTLPGIARKSANVILSTWYEKNEGIVVDTHMIRLVFRMGLSKSKTPVQIEQELMKIVPQKNWSAFSHAMVWHGRRVCSARSPACHSCVISKFCPKNGVSLLKIAESP